MENSLKPQPLMAEVLPGFTVLFILAYAYCVANPGTFSLAANSRNVATIVGGGIIVLFVSWIIGTFLDTLRDLVESLVDLKFPVNRSYLFSESTESVKKLEDSWLAYYFLTGNMAIGLIVTAILAGLFREIHISVLWLCIICLVALVYLYNFFTLREEIRELIGYDQGLPHESTYTRIAKSTAPHSAKYEGTDPGVGVVAIRDIPKGTLIFAPDDDKTIRISSIKVAALTPELRKLYDDFCPLESDYYTCPMNFNKLTVAWYLNDSETPNCEVDGNLKIRALRDIKAGDELFSRYSDYCE